MDFEAARMIGAGLAAIGAGLAALGVGNVFASFLEGALRNPGAADGQQGRLFIGFAAAELLGLLAFLVAIILVFVAAPTATAAPEATPVAAEATEAPAAEEAPATEEASS